MREVTITRTEHSDQGTFGLLVIDDNTWTCVTGELPWRDNQRKISCVPWGTYICAMAYSPHFKRDLYHLAEVEGRSEVMIHNGNFCGDESKGYDSHVEGCILLGAKVGLIENKKRELQKPKPKHTQHMRQFENIMNNEPFELTIKELI